MDRLQQMQSFVLVCDQGSFTVAAETLGCSSASVSRAVEQLEAHLGVRLLQRTTRRLQLTEVGERVLAHCRQMLQMQDSLQDIARQGQQQLQGTIRLAVTNSLIQAGLDQILADFIQQYPAVRLEIFATDQTVDLLEAKVDLALRISPNLALGLIAKPLAHCYSVLCATPAYLAQQGCPNTPNELAMHQCLSHQHVGQRIWRMQDAGQWQDYSIETLVSCNDTHSLLLLTRQHLGIAMLPHALVLPDLKTGHLVQVLADYPLEALTIYAVYMSRQYVPRRVRCLLEFVQQQMQMDPRWFAPA